MLESNSIGPRTLSLGEIGDEAVGGKAAGLAQLINMGLDVPPGFVIVNAQQNNFPSDLTTRYTQIGQAKVAVRSSAIGEDGVSASFAGQYETILDVEGLDQLHKAINACVASLHSEHAQQYSHEQSDVESPQMCVVVQTMVDAASAGVLFTADPVSGRHDRMVIDAVAGLGESLVSGEQTPDHYELNLANAIVRQDLTAEAAILTEAQISTLAIDARKAAAARGDHLDMEWAIDQSGQLHWLQARPITTLGCDLNDGFTPIAATDVITRCNVGEMMPGPVCPLTFSTQGRGIEHGMQHMHLSYAGRPRITDEWTQINLFYGHMFINLSGGLESARFVSLTTAEVMGQTMCGMIIPQLKDPSNKKSLPRRWWGSWKFVQYCLRATKVIAEFDSRFEHFQITYSDDISSMIQEMENNFPWLLETDEVHLRSSSYSGLMEGIVQGVVSGKNKNPSDVEAAALQAEAARLLAGATGVESAVMVQQLDAIVDLIATNPDEAISFRQLTPTQGLEWLRSDASGDSGTAFTAFLQRHGHRGYRELCVREKAWRDEPAQLVITMQASIAARLTQSYSPRQHQDIDLSTLGSALKWLLPHAHKSIRQREQTKSMLVEATYRLKCGYRHLGKLLAAQGLLEDEDLVFFLSREELSAFCRAPNKELAELTILRRRTLEFQEKLEFEDVHVGFAEPTDYQPIEASSENELIGRPVSRGVVEGIARVAVTLEEASHLQLGEILVSRITDVGWTPYFSLIGGLATDVGSAVSHGAVIAREYGLPAIVNLRVATKVIQTGDRVRLDADKGILTRLG